MKTNKLLVLIILLLSIHSFSQSKFGEKREQIKALKVGFITNELALTPEEASRFWPIYNVFDDKQFELRHQKMKSIKDRLEDESIDKMNEKEATILLAQIESNEDELYVTRKKFNANLKGIISPIKIIKLKKAEENFNRKLLQQYRDKGPRK
jgi:hypothetical protein